MRGMITPGAVSNAEINIAVSLMTFCSNFLDNVGEPAGYVRCASPTMTTKERKENVLTRISSVEFLYDFEVRDLIVVVDHHRLNRCRDHGDAR